MQSVRVLTAAPLLALAIGACASTQSPVLYPNRHLQWVGSQQAERDIAECRRLASQYVRSTATKDIAKGGVVGGLAGAAIGAVAGAVTGGSAGRGAAIGAATGGTSGAARSALKQTKPSPVYKRFVNRCLTERGYAVLGWQ